MTECPHHWTCEVTVLRLEAYLLLARWILRERAATGAERAAADAFASNPAAR